MLSPCIGQVAHALLTRPPLRCFIVNYSTPPLDLHVLGTPPAFILSQDQTLKLKFALCFWLSVPSCRLSIIQVYLLGFNTLKTFPKTANCQPVTVNRFVLLAYFLHCVVFKDHLSMCLGDTDLIILSLFFIYVNHFF